MWKNLKDSRVNDLVISHGIILLDMSEIVELKAFVAFKLSLPMIYYIGVPFRSKLPYWNKYSKTRTIGRCLFAFEGTSLDAR